MEATGKNIYRIPSYFNFHDYTHQLEMSTPFLLVLEAEQRL
jgi:hypothetical protein